MKAKDLCEQARRFAQKSSCYLPGAWGQYLSQGEYNRLCAMYPRNEQYHNESYVGTECYPFDCICFVKALTAGATVGNRISYSQLAAGPLGDCTTAQFLNAKLYDKCDPKDAKAGYGLATSGHAGIALGDGMWIDANKTAGQNGLQIHSTGIETFTAAGKIPGIVYESDDPEPIIDTERVILTNFTNWLVDTYLKQK